VATVHAKTVGLKSLQEYLKEIAEKGDEDEPEEEENSGNESDSNWEVFKILVKHFWYIDLHFYIKIHTVLKILIMK